MRHDLFEEAGHRRRLSPGAVLLPGFAGADASSLLEDVETVVAQAPFRHLITPGGRRMSVAMTNCGALGWTSSPAGYRYLAIDPETRRRWPAMPPRFRALAREAAEAGGFAGFDPDACLINRYAVGARLTLHQDRDEGDLTAPIVSVSLGLKADFLWGGLSRSDRAVRVPVHHGDVVVWGGPSRLVFHGIDILRDGDDPLTGPFRLNLTFRAAR